MSVQRILTLPGHVPAGKLASAITDVIGKEVDVRERPAAPTDGVDLWFVLSFREPGRSRLDREISCHHGHATDDPPFPGQPYTYMATGAFGCTDEVLRTLGRRFGGFYVDEDTGAEISFVDAEASASAPSL